MGGYHRCWGVQKMGDLSNSQFYFLESWDVLDRFPKVQRSSKSYWWREAEYGQEKARSRKDDCGHCPLRQGV